jgi:hypothetical protein
MDIPFDVDLIFGFLMKHPASLAACSAANLVFFRMVKKYQHHCLIVYPESPRQVPLVQALRLEA